MQRIVVALLLTVWIMQAQASAQVTVYTSQAAFQAALSPTPAYYKETFDSLTQDPTPIFNFSSAPYSYTATAPTSNLFVNNTPDNVDIWLSPSSNTDSIVFTFTSNNISAAGGFFFTTDSGGLAAPGTIQVTVNGNPTQTITLTDPTSFLGFTSSSPFSTLTVTAVQGAQDLWPNANDFIVGVAAVPEPATWALIGISTSCLAGGIVYRRRKRLAEESAEVDIPVSA
ncbi:MAG TPA: PEP-CTERM sorting domain-containing protein [Gemmatales bacterium]|nr:PEP-CTERM sorting domain-containing protein [Gemmatales bacterium]